MTESYMCVPDLKKKKKDNQEGLPELQCGGKALQQYSEDISVVTFNQKMPVYVCNDAILVAEP